MNIKDYAQAVLQPILLVTILSAIVPIVFKSILLPSLWSALCCIAVSIISVGVTVWLVGLTATERSQICDAISKFLVKQKHHD
jgi:VIT1/CCC1 family predicted Fe2+/Mn2+ transporter